MRKLQLKNKKGQGFIGIILFFLALLTILIIGFVAAMIVGIVDYSSDTLTPIMEDLGMVDGTNMSEVSGYTFGTVDTIVQALPWLVALSYVACLIFTIAFIFLTGYTQHPAFIGIYFVFIILLIFGCVIMSNMYQDIYTGTDEIATRLQDQTLLSFMILNSPFMMFMISVIGGIVIFTRASNEAGAGGLGV